MGRERVSDLEAHLRSALQSSYRIERELGAGGMATVYLAEDVRHHRQVAIKVLHPELASHSGAGMAERSSSAVARTSSPYRWTEETCHVSAPPFGCSAARTWAARDGRGTMSRPMENDS